MSKNYGYHRCPERIDDVLHCSNDQSMQVPFFAIFLVFLAWTKCRHSYIKETKS